MHNNPKIPSKREGVTGMNGNLSAIYGVVAFLSILLCGAYLIWDKKKNFLFSALFACVAASNGGYFMLAVCNSLPAARFANGMSYFGGAFSLLLMLLIIYDICRYPKRRWVTWSLTGISFSAFALAACCDWMGLYYRSVSLERINGMTRLIKEYGPLHSLYAVYLAVYVLLMLGLIIYAARSKKLSSPKYAQLLMVAVLLNVAVWLVEQTIIEEFEFLSVSYIVTAVLLLLIYNMLYDYGIIRPDVGIISAQMLTQLNSPNASDALPAGMEDMFSAFAEKVKTLTAAERRILNYYMDGYDTGDIPELAYISIHTVKKHNHSIYQKLEVSSRDELLLYIELFRCCGRLAELTADPVETE